LAQLAQVGHETDTDYDKEVTGSVSLIRRNNSVTTSQTLIVLRRGTLNLREWTKQELTMRHHVAGMDNAGVDNSGVVKCL